MAYHRSLPVWKAAMDLAVHLEHAVRRFPRYHKYTLGSELRQTAQRLCQQVARANALPGAARAQALDELVMNVESMKRSSAWRKKPKPLPISTNSPQPPNSRWVWANRAGGGGVGCGLMLPSVTDGARADVYCAPRSPARFGQPCPSDQA